MANTSAGVVVMAVVVAAVAHNCRKEAEQQKVQHKAEDVVADVVPHDVLEAWEYRMEGHSEVQTVKLHSEVEYRLGGNQAGKVAGSLALAVAPLRI